MVKLLYLAVLAQTAAALTTSLYNPSTASNGVVSTKSSAKHIHSIKTAKPYTPLKATHSAKYAVATGAATATTATRSSWKSVHKVKPTTRLTFANPFRQIPHRNWRWPFDLAHATAATTTCRASSIKAAYTRTTTRARPSSTKSSIARAKPTHHWNPFLKPNSMPKPTLKNDHHTADTTAKPAQMVMTNQAGWGQIPSRYIFLTTLVIIWFVAAALTVSSTATTPSTGNMPAPTQNWHTNLAERDAMPTSILETGDHVPEVTAAPVYKVKTGRGVSFARILCGPPLPFICCAVSLIAAAFMYLG